MNFDSQEVVFVALAHCALPDRGQCLGDCVCNATQHLQQVLASDAVQGQFERVIEMSLSMASGAPGCSWYAYKCLGWKEGLRTALVIIVVSTGSLSEVA